LFKVCHFHARPLPFRDKNSINSARKMARNSHNPPQTGGNEQNGTAKVQSYPAVMPVAEEERIGHLQFSRPRTSTPLRTQATSPLAWVANISPNGDWRGLDTHPDSIREAIATNISFITAQPIDRRSGCESSLASELYATPCDRLWSGLSERTMVRSRRAE
jgi:hypothetical protein